MCIASVISKRWKRSATRTVFHGEGVCLIEWADLIQEILPPDVIAIEIEKNLEKGFDYRKITISDPEEKKAQL